MKNTVEAELAIRKLDGKPIGSFSLKVSPAISKEEKDRRKKIQEVIDLSTIECIKKIANPPSFYFFLYLINISHPASRSN